MESKEGEGQYIRRGMNGGGEDEKGAGRRERETGIFPPKLDRQGQFLLSFTCLLPNGLEGADF